MATICPNCHTNQLDGTIFCLECGASLLVESAHESTRQFGMAPLPSTGGLSARPGTGPVGNDASLTLVIAHNGRRLHVAASDSMVIGRADPNKGITPDIDLGPEGGFDAGVSRRHAVLAHSSGAYTVEDLGSANGTYVNGRRLTPQAVVPIRSGDELRCGTLVLRIEIG